MSSTTHKLYEVTYPRRLMVAFLKREFQVIDIGSNKKMVILHLKFMPDRPLYQYLTYLQLELKKIKDKDGERVLATQMKGIPQKIEL